MSERHEKGGDGFGIAIGELASQEDTDPAVVAKKPLVDDEVDWENSESFTGHNAGETNFEFLIDESILGTDYDDRILEGSFEYETPVATMTLPAGQIRAKLDKKNYRGQLIYKASIENVDIILSHDERIAGKIAMHSRRKAPVFVGDVDLGISNSKTITVPEARGYLDLSDAHANLIRRWCETRFDNGGYGLEKLSKDTVDVAIEGVANTYEFDPVKELFEEIEWDGTERLPMLFVDYLKAEDNAFHREAAEMLMVGLAARTYEPGCDFQHFFILCGVAEGAGKSEFFQVLSGNHYKQIYQGELKNMKDISVEFRGPAFLLHDELASLQGLSYSDLNAYFQLSAADARLPYGRRTEYFEFPFVNVGTSNDLTPLRTPNKDAGRRYNPIIIGEGFHERNQIDNNKLRRELPQIYAEAKVKYLKKISTRSGFEPLRWKFSEAAQRIKARILASARAETDSGTLAGLIESVMMSPVPAAELPNIKAISRWQNDWLEHDGKVYRRSWNRPSLLSAVRDAHIDNPIINEEMTKSGKGSSFGPIMKELGYVVTGSSRLIRGLEKFGQQQSYQIDPIKFGVILNHRNGKFIEEHLDDHTGDDDKVTDLKDGPMDYSLNDEDDIPFG